MPLEQLPAILEEALQSGSLVAVGFAYLGGVVSTLLPCTVAMLPILIGYVGGYAQTESKWDVLVQVLLFIAGLALMMTILGVLAGVVGLTFGYWAGSWWYYVVAAVAVVMGLQLLEVIQIPMPQFIAKLPEGGVGKTGPAKLVAPVVLGMAFGAASSPCGTPFLAVIMALISNSKNLVLGGAALFAYALGQGTLLLIVGMFTGLLKHMATARRVGSIITKMSAVVFFLVAAVLIIEASGLGEMIPVLEWLGL